MAILSNDYNSKKTGIAASGVVDIVVADVVMLSVIMVGVIVDDEAENEIGLTAVTTKVALEMMKCSFGMLKEMTIY